MANISYRAASTLTNRYGWNGGNEYEDEGELNYSNTFYRKYDAQIGRFTGVDMLAEATADLTPYHFGGNNPVMFNDPRGDMMALGTGRMQKGPDGNYHVGWVNEMMWNNIGFFDWGDGGGGGGGQGSASGNYSNIMGMTSASILSQMSFGDKFGKNKSGEYGFWSSYSFRPTDRGYVEAGRNGSTLAEVSVGSGRTWTALGRFGQAFPSFETLWNNYPENNIVDGVESPAHPSSNPKYENQCAIRMSECLIKSGFSLKGYPKDDLDEDNKRWALTANRLKYFLSQQIKPTEILTQAKFEEKYWDKTGIIFIVPPKGGIGHIDLFNKGVTGSGYYAGDKIWFWEIL